jgi:hypothetical protein
MMIAVTPRVDVREWITFREHARFLRTQRHLTVAVVGVVAGVVVAPASNTLAGFTLIAILVGVVLSSLARAVDAHMGYLWGWLYSEPKQSTRLDRFVDRAIHSLLVTQVIDDAPVRVRPLNPPMR